MIALTAEPPQIARKVRVSPVIPPEPRTSALPNGLAKQRKLSIIAGPDELIRKYRFAELFIFVGDENGQKLLEARFEAKRKNILYVHELIKLEDAMT